MLQVVRKDLYSNNIILMLYAAGNLSIPKFLAGGWKTLSTFMFCNVVIRKNYIYIFV